MDEAPTNGAPPTFEDELADLQDQIDADFGGEKPAVVASNVLYTVGNVGKDLGLWSVAIIAALIAWRMAKKYRLIK